MPTFFLWAIVILLVLIWLAVIGVIVAVNNLTTWFAQLEIAIENGHKKN